MIFHVAFYRKDLSVSYLEDIYFNEYSHYLDLEIPSLDGTALSIKIHYQEYGNSNHPVIVLLHGMFDSLGAFLKWKDILVDQGYRVILIDLPYHGLSEGFTDYITSLRRSAYVVYEVVKFLNINQIIIGGNSMGGGVSWYFASEFHDPATLNVKGLILIDSVYQEQGQKDRGIFFNQSWIINWVSKMTPKFLLRYILNGVYGSEAIILLETLNRYYDMIRKEGYRQSILILKREDLSDDLNKEERIGLIKSFGIEVLIMWGEEDSWIDKEVGYLLSNDLDLMPNRLIIYQGLGHVPMEENPDLTSVDLILFLNEIDN